MSKSKKSASKESVSSSSVDDNTDPNQVTDAVKGSMKGDVVKQESSPKMRILENGVSTSEVENPGPGNPGAASPGATRGAMGGGSAYGGSAQFGANSRGPSTMRHDRSQTGFDKLIERDSYQIDDTTSTTIQLEIDSVPSMYDSDEFKSPMYIEADTRFKVDNAHPAGKAEVFSNPFEHSRLAEMTKDQLIFARGQNVRYCHESDALPDIRYPTHTNAAVNGQIVIDSVNVGHPSNFLLRGIMFGIVNGKVVDVRFEAPEISTHEQAQGDLAYRVDHRKTHLNIATDKVNDKMRKALNDASNIDKRLYTPLVDAVPDPIELMMLMSDVVASDGLVAALALRSYASALTKLKQYRTTFGSGDGAFEQLWDMICPYAGGAYYRTDADVPDIDDIKSTSAGLASGITAAAYVLSMDSPRKYVTPGDFFTQPRGLLMPFKHAIANFDRCGFKGDATALKAIQSIMTKANGRGATPIIGCSNIGLIIPYDPNALYEFDADTCTLRSKLKTVDYVPNSALVQRLGSPFWAGIVETFAIELLPRLLAMNSSWLANNAVDVEDGVSGATYLEIPFDFSTDHISFFQMLCADAFARIPKHVPVQMGVYLKFIQDYGFDPIVDDTICPITQADALKGSVFKAVSEGYALSEPSRILELLFYDPERITIEPGPGDRNTGLGRNWIGSGAVVRGHWAYSTAYDTSDEPIASRHRVRFPIFRKGGLRSKGFSLIESLGAKAYYRSRDLPIRMPQFDTTSVTSRHRVISDCSVPVAWMSGTPVQILVPSEAPYPLVAGTTVNAELTIRNYLACQRENGRVAPAPNGILDYNSGHDNHGFEFVVTSLDNAICSMSHENELDDPTDLLHNTIDAHFINNPVETYRLKGVFQDIGPDTNLVIDNVYGSMLHRHMWCINSHATADQFATLLESFGIIVSTDGFDGGVNTQGLADATPYAYYAIDGAFQQNATLGDPVTRNDRAFMDLYPMLYFESFVTNPFYGSHDFELSGTPSNRGNIPLSAEQIAAEHIIENTSYSFERMLGLLGYATIDWDEYALSVASRKEATIDYIVTNEYEDADNILSSGVSSASSVKQDVASE